MRKSKKSENYLDKIPVQKMDSELDEEGKIAILIPHKGIFDRIFQKLLKKPKISYIHLDDFGTFVWQQIDGGKSVMDIASLVKEAFGEAAEPLYPRIVEYFRRLESYGFVGWK